MSGADRKPSGAPSRTGWLVVAGADHAVRADEAAVTALDAQVGVPGRDQLRDVAFLILRRAGRVRAVHRQRADRQLIARAPPSSPRSRCARTPARGRGRPPPARARPSPARAAPRGEGAPASGRPRSGCARTTSAPRLPYVLAIDALIRSIASSRSSTPLIAKKHVWSTVLVRPARPASRAIFAASITYSLICLARICSWTGRASASQTRSGGCLAVEQQRRPRRRPVEHFGALQ